ncbi:uncharacterized protein LOC116846351 isoform X2 [Odontomachus brunneus]|uniref:uncharacterized protein LOC116846351 isoform X2 n=1 Tax=Odontomachus brunneus TaxID=486640 RepID=UPI0013F1F9EF|nr:uncharacterized protein LOC116846351 isoform X2 [Odontomachus brunneus]
MAEYDHHSNNKHRHRSADSRHRHRLNAKLDAANSPIDVESHVTNETSTNHLNREAVDLRGFSAESASRCEFVCKRRRTDHDSTDESRTECSAVPSNNRTHEYLSDFRTQQSSSKQSRLNRETLRSKRDDSRDSASLLSETRHGKHRENILTKGSLRNTQDSATTQSKKKNHDSKLDQEVEILPSSATANADKISTRDIPKCSSFEGKSLSDIQEESTDCNSSGEEIMKMKRSDDANSTRSSLTTGSLDTLVKNCDFETNDNIFCNNKLDLSSDSRISGTKTYSEAEAVVNNNVVTATSTQHVQISQSTDRRRNTLSTREMNIDYKTGVKRKLASNEDDTLLEKIQKKNQTDTLADVNMTNSDIQVSSNTERSVYDESTEDERDSVIEDNVKEQWTIQRRNKRYTKRKKDMRALSKMKTTKTFKGIRSLFRNLFGENITKSESEEERAFLKSKSVVQEKSIDSCSTEERDTENDDMSVYKDDVDDSRKDVKDKSPVKMEHEMNPLVADDTKNVISKNDISAEVFVAKTDTQEASKVAAKVAKVNMEEYISKDEMRELLLTLRQNLMNVIENIFKREEQNDRWSSEVKQILREIQECNTDESNFSSDKDANVHKDSNSSAVLSNLFSNKLVSDIKDRESNDNCNIVNLTLMKNDIFSENTNTMTTDHELMLEKGSVREDETCTVREDSCVDNASVTQFTNIDSILSSKDNTSSASNVVVNRSLTPTSLKESRDEAYNVNENVGTNTFADQPSTDTSNPQSLRNDITDNEVQLEIKVKAKAGFTSETFTLKIPPSTRAKYNLNNLKNNFRRMILEISSEITASANANRTEKDDASEGALNTNQVTTTKNIETMSSIQQVSYDSNHATQTSINRPLQQEDFQDDLRSINDRENVMERNEAGNDQCVQSVERESLLQTASISAKNSTESSTSVCSVPDLKTLPPKSSLSESKKHNEEILKECLTAKTQSGWSTPTSVNLTVAGTSDTANSVTTVASPRVSQGFLLTNTSFITTSVATSFSTTTCTSTGNLYGQHKSNEEIQLISSIGNLIMSCRGLFHNNINNQLNLTPDMIAITIALYNNMMKLKTFLTMNNMYKYDTINYAVHRLNFSMLQNCPTSVEEINKIFNLSNIRDNRSLVVASGTNTMASTSAQKSSQSQKSQSVQSRSITGGEIPDIRTQVTRNTTSHMGYPNQATGTAVNEQRFENSMNNATSMLQQRQKSTVNSSQRQSSSNMDYMQTSQLNPNITINLSRLADNTNILRIPQTNSPSTSINRQRSSDNTNNILRMQQPGASMENVERQQSSNSTNNMSQPSQITTNMEQQQLSAGTSNVSHIQQLSLVTGNIGQPRSSANINNIPCIPQPSPATVNVRRQSSDNMNNILHMPLSIPLTTANIKRLSANTSDILRVPRSSPAMGNIEQRQSSANIKNIQFVPNSDLNNTATALGFIPSGSTTTSISQQQFLINNPHITSHILNARQHAMMEKYQQLDRLGFQPSGNVSNVPHVPHLSLPVLNSNQTSQSTNVAVHSSREPLREKLSVSNQQQFYPGYPEYPNFHMSLPGTENVSPHPSYANLRNPISLPTSTITSDNVRQEQGLWMASLRNNSKATAFIPNAQQQANFQQQSNGSTPITQNTMPNYTVALTAPHLLRNHFINSQAQIRQSYRIPSPQYNIHAYSVLNNQPQSHITGLNPLQISATKATYQRMNVDQQSRVTMYDATAKYLNVAPASIAMQQTSQKTRSLRQNDFLANVISTVSSNPLTNIPSNTQQSLSNVKTQKRKYTHKSKTAKTLTTRSELTRQEILKNPVFFGRNIPQNSTTDAGVLVASLDVSQKKATSSSHTKETSSARSSMQVAQNVLMKRVNESAQTSASQENPATKSFSQKRKVETTVVTEDTSNLRTLLSNISENRSNLSSNPSNSEMQNTAQSTPTAQGLSQSAAHINLNVFTDIQKLIIQSHLDTYFQMSLTTLLHIFTKQQLEAWKSDRSLLHCFHDSLSKYLSKLVLEKQATELTREDEAQSLLPCREQKESAGQQKMTELRRDKRLEKTIQCLRDDTKSNASKSTPEDLSTRPQNEESLGTSNLSKSATTETSSSGLVESPQRDEDTSTLCPAPLLEKSNVPREDPSREDSTTETRDGAAEPDGTAESVKQEPAEQPSIDTEIKQNPTDECKEKPGSNVRQEQSDRISVKKCEPVNVIQHETEKLKNLSEDVIEINPIDLCQSPPDAKAHHYEIVNEQLMPKEKKVLEISQDFETSERVWYMEKCGQWRDTQSIDTLSEDEEKGTAFIDIKLETNNEQLDHSSETRHREEPQAFLIKNEGISDADTYEKDIIIKDDILVENDVVAYNFTELEDETLKLNIINICNISSTLFEKMDSNTFLSQDDQLHILGEGEDTESARESSNSNNNSEIVNEEDVPCLRCKRNSTVCCENCLAAYYCSERCSKLHWYSSHHKHCKPYNQNLPD